MNKRQFTEQEIRIFAARAHFRAAEQELKTALPHERPHRRHAWVKARAQLDHAEIIVVRDAMPFQNVRKRRKARLGAA